MSTEDRGSFDSEWVGFRNEVLRKLDLEFSIRLGLLASDERMEPPGNLTEKMRDLTSSVIESRQEQVGDDLYNRAKEQGVGFYTYAMYAAYKTSNRFALEVVKNARKEGRNEFVEDDLLAAMEALKKEGRYWPFS